MKTIEQKREDAIKYLRQTSKHLFMDKKETLVRVVEIGPGEFERIFLTKEGKEDKRKISLEYFFKHYPNDPKNLCKGSLFPHEHGLKSVKMKLLKKYQQMETIPDADRII
jgi:hypothetical protein